MDNIKKKAEVEAKSGVEIKKEALPKNSKQEKGAGMFQTDEMMPFESPLDQHKVSSEEIENIQTAKNFVVDGTDFSVEKFKSMFDRIGDDRLKKDLRSVRIPNFILESYVFMGLKGLTGKNFQEVVAVILASYLEEKKTLITKEVEKASRNQKKTDFFIS